MPRPPSSHHSPARRRRRRARAATPAGPASLAASPMAPRMDDGTVRPNGMRAGQRGVQYAHEEQLSRTAAGPQHRAPSRASHNAAQPTPPHQPLGQKLPRPIERPLDRAEKSIRGDEPGLAASATANGAASQGSPTRRLPRLPGDALLAQLAQKKALRQRRMLLLRLATMFLAICVSVLLLVVWLAVRPNPNNTGWQVNLPQALNVAMPPDMVVLLMGVDVNAAAGQDPALTFQGVRTDTMVLARIDTPEPGEDGDPQISMVSIPRDSKVYLTEAGSIGKINGAFAMGGPEQALRVVERTTGIPVDYYAVINLHGVKDVVDAIGGVDVVIEAPMRYHDNTGKLHIDFQPGNNHLSGQQAVEYLRFRHDSLGDIGRIRRQQSLMNAIASRMKDPWTLARLPGIINAVQRNMQTNFPAPLLLQLGWLAKSLTPHDIQVSTLPGSPVSEGASYWQVDAESARTVINSMILKDRLYDQYGMPDEDTSADLTGMAAASGDFSGMAPVRVGLITTRGWTDAQREAMEAALSEGGFSVVCRDSRKRVMTQLVEHRGVKQLPQRLKATGLPRLMDLQHVISPIGSTYESNFCSGREALTLMLGDDAQAMVKPVTATPQQ